MNNHKECHCRRTRQAAVSTQKSRGRQHVGLAGDRLSSGGGLLEGFQAGCFPPSTVTQAAGSSSATGAVGNRGAEPNRVLTGVGYRRPAFIFPIGYKGGSGVAEGLRFGAVIGLLWWLPANVTLLGVYETTLASALVDGIGEGVAGGVVIGLLHVRGAAASLEVGQSLDRT